MFSISINRLLSHTFIPTNQPKPTHRLHATQSYAVGDSVFVQSSEKLPFIGRLTTIKPDKVHGGHELKIFWFYRPEDQAIEGGRKMYHGKHELFESDHSDLIHSDTVMGPCYVHSYEDYLNLDTVTSIDYFCRWKYMVKKKKFYPEKVNIYCRCKLPENPDEWMVHCNTCDEWYHSRCINITEEEVDAMDEYICDDCQRPMHR